MLIVVFCDSPIVIREFALTEYVSKLHVVRDDNQLEVLLITAALHDFDKRPRESVRVWRVEICRRLVKR